MGKQNLPWVREWEQLDLPLNDDGASTLMFLLQLLAFVVLALTLGYFFVVGVINEADLATAHADGQRIGRLELLQRVEAEVAREGKDFEAFYRAASQPGLSGFGGVLLVGNTCKGWNQ